MLPKFEANRHIFINIDDAIEFRRRAQREGQSLRRRRKGHWVLCLEINPHTLPSCEVHIDETRRFVARGKVININPLHKSFVGIRQ